MLIGSYNANYGRRQLWMYVGALSVFFIGGSVYVLILWPARFAVQVAVICMVGWLATLCVYLFFLPWRVELTVAEFRWHALLRTRAVPLTRVRSISRTHRDTVCVKFDGRGPLRIKAGPGRLGTLADHIKAAAPHVTIVPPSP